MTIFGGHSLVHLGITIGVGEVVEVVGGQDMAVLDIGEEEITDVITMAAVVIVAPVGVVEAPLPVGAEEDQEVVLAEAQEVVRVADREVAALEGAVADQEEVRVEAALEGEEEDVDNKNVAFLNK